MARNKVLAGRLARELLDTLGPAPDRLALLSGIQGWLKLNLPKWSIPSERNTLASILDFNLLDYPTDLSGLEPRTRVQRIEEYLDALNMGRLAAEVAGVFLDGVSVTTSHICPSCEGNELRVWRDDRSGLMSVCCDTCTWARNVSGRASEWDDLQVPTRTEILRWMERGLLMTDDHGFVITDKFRGHGF